MVLLACIKIAITFAGVAFLGILYTDGHVNKKIGWLVFRLTMGIIVGGLLSWLWI